MADSQLIMSRLTAFFPIAGWLKTYTREDFNSDLLAGIITAILLVPQGIAYAILAGLPPELGLYASILPPALYALLGTSRTLSVGPAAVAAIMIASALNAPEVSALGKPVQSALILSAESGLMMLLMALLRLGGLVNFISHPVLRGFTSGASLLIIVSQIPHTLGLKSPACGLDVACYSRYVQGFNGATLWIALAALGLLLLFGKPLTTLLKKTGVPPIRFHDLRHTAASLMLNHGVPVIVASRRLGHAKPSITLDIYGHLIPSMQAEAAQLLDELVTPVEIQRLHPGAPEFVPPATQES